MAKPIKSTQELTGEEANKFLEKMIFLDKSKITFKQKEFAKKIDQNMRLLQVC